MQDIDFAASVSLIAFESNEKADSQKNGMDTAEKHNEAKFDKIGEKEAQSVVDAYYTGLYQVRLADSASKYAVSKEAKTGEMRMSEVFNMMNGQLKEITSKKQISLPTDINNDERNDIMKLSEKKNKDVDIAFSEEGISKGKDATNMLDHALKISQIQISKHDLQPPCLN